MKFQGTGKDLLAAVTAAAAPIRRTPIPVLECVLIRAGDRLTFTGSSLDIEVMTTCRASVTESGALAVNADDLKRYLSNVGDAVVTVEGGDRLAMSAGRTRCSLATFPADEFPVPMKPDAPHEVIGAAEALPFCASYAGSDPAREFINGVRVFREGCVATDGRHMAVHPATCEITVTIPNAAVRTISDILARDGRLFVGENVWRAEAENIAAKGKLLDYSYPDWQCLTTAASVPILTCDASDLLASIQSATLGLARQVFMESGDGAVALSGEGWPVARAESSAICAAEIEQPFAGAFDVANIVAALKPLSGSTISVHCMDGGVWSVSVVGGDGRQVLIYPWRHARSAWPEVRVAA